LLRAMRLAREGCKSVLQPGLLSCFRNAEERRRCEVMEAALRPQKRGPRQRTSVSACRVRWEENATRRAALARACFCTPQVRLGSRKAAAKQVRIRASMVHSVFRLCVGVTRKQRSSAGMRRNCGLLSTIRLLRVAREGQGQQQQQHPHPHPPQLHQQPQEAAAAARTRPVMVLVLRLTVRSNSSNRAMTMRARVCVCLCVCLCVVCVCLCVCLCVLRRSCCTHPLAATAASPRAAA
jgi:hypothetical protein